MTDRDERARLRILQAFERAKATDPSITQGAFMRAGAPGSRVKGLPGKFKSDDSASRYFRKIRSGERTGGAMYRQGTEDLPGRMIGLFQFKVRTAEGRYISQNIDVAKAYSTFDNAAIEYELKRNQRTRVEAMIAAYRERYGQEEAEIDLDSLEVRPIRHQRRPIRMRLSL
jgi:hypothetical protein